MFRRPIKPPKALQLFSKSCQEKDVANTMHLRGCNPYFAPFPELRRVFADAREAYTGLRSKYPLRVYQRAVSYFLPAFLYTPSGVQEGTIIFPGS